VAEETQMQKLACLACEVIKLQGKIGTVVNDEYVVMAMVGAGIDTPLTWRLIDQYLAELRSASKQRRAKT
jgi:hypothetical protein